MKDRLETIIRDWLNIEFKNPDAIPGLLISGIAEEINKHRWEIHSRVDEEYRLEDIEAVEISNKVNLTEEEKKLALDRYRDLEESHMDELSWIINEIINEREHNSLSSLSAGARADATAQTSAENKRKEL